MTESRQIREEGELSEHHCHAVPESTPPCFRPILLSRSTVRCAGLVSHVSGN
jgi:hypothetical protein